MLHCRQLMATAQSTANSPIAGKDMSFAIQSNSILKALAELREVLSRSQSYNTEVSDLLKQMEVIASKIEKETAASIAFVKPANIAGSITPL
jgi:hypothetical protein